MQAKRILLIIGGGIAAYKCLDLIRRLREEGASVRAVMTKAAGQFVTPLSVGALSNNQVYVDLFDLNEEREIGHIRLSRETDLILVAPATADLLAKMAHGLANDLASTVLLASNKPILVAPAMNPKMWLHPATQRNAKQLTIDGVVFVGPDNGEMAESGEAGFGRMVPVPELIAAIKSALGVAALAPIATATAASATSATLPTGVASLHGRHVLVTAGPTHEPIDPVRYIANRSSGKQGYAIAGAAAAAGASVTMISGPTSLRDPMGVTTIRVETADEMLQAVRKALPADIAIFTAAVADWRVATPNLDKIKKTSTKPRSDAIAYQLDLVENPDILAIVSNLAMDRPALVIGFAAETKDLIKHAKAKLARKGCDWIVANNVSPGLDGSVMGGDHNEVHLITEQGVASWPQMPKSQVAVRLIMEAAGALPG